MSLLDRVRSIFSRRASSTVEQDDLITAYDSFGRELRIARGEWATKILPGSLAEAHDDPDRLYDVIVMALEDGFGEQLLDASSRLLEIDRNFERSHTVRGIVLMKSGKLGAAEEILSSFVDKHGPSGVVLTNLAKVYDATGRRAEADGTLWKAIQLDPNQENGLLWWCSLEQEKHGEEGLWSAMAKAAALRGSWRPQLWLARQALEQKNVQQARSHYRHVLAMAANEPGVLMMISGDLGNHGQLAQIIELVLPVYDAARHDPWTGLNLLEACLRTNELAEGESLVHRMFELNRPDLKDRLFYYSAEFDKLRASSPREFAAEDEKISIEVLPIERPMWSYGLRDPAWLLADDAERQDEVVFIPLANLGTGLRQPTEQREDDLGRLTRSLPLYLMESAYFWTGLKPKMSLPILRGRGPVVVGTPWTEDQIQGLAEGAKFAVAGTLEQSGDELKIELTTWNCELGKQEDTFRYSTPLDRLGETVLQIERDVTRGLAGDDVLDSPRESYYRKPEVRLLPHYLACLGQTLMLSLVQGRFVSKEGLWGERNILEHCLWLALETTDCQVPRIMFASALAKSHEYGSTVTSEFKRQTLELVQQKTDRSSPFYRLSPFVLRIFDPEQFHLRKADLLKDATGSFREWLDSLSVN